MIGDARVLTLTQARGRAVEVLSAHSEGELPALLNKSVILSKYLDETYGPVVKLKNKTANKDIRRIQDKFSNLLSKPLNEITRAKLEKYRLDRLKAGIAKSTINRDISPLKRALNFAVEKGILSENPLAKLETFTAKELDNEIVRYLSPAEKKNYLLHWKAETIILCLL